MSCFFFPVGISAVYNFDFNNNSAIKDKQKGEKKEEEEEEERILSANRLDSLYIGVVPTCPALNNSPELLNAVVTSLFRHTTCSTSASIHGKTLKGGKMRSYEDTRRENC